MKKQKTKFDFFAINRAMNQNFNGKKDYFGWNKKLDKGEEMKLNRKEQKNEKHISKEN